MHSVPLPFTLDEYDARLKKVRWAMHRRGIDVLIIADPSNMSWLTGYDGWSFYVHQAVVVAAEGEPIWWGRPMDAVGARMTTWLSPDSITAYNDDFVQNPLKHPYSHLAEVLRERDLANGRFGVEMDNYYFSAACLETLRRELPDVEIMDATALVNWNRAVKSEQELIYMRRAARIVEAMHERIREVAEPGVRKCDVIASIYDVSVRGAGGHGGDYAAIVPLTPSGPEAAAAHLTWDDRPMREGEGTFFEIAGCHRRYHCPLSRTLYLGTPPADMLRAQDAILEGMEAALDMARPGNACGEVADVFFGILAKHGIGKLSRAGYAIGLSYPPDWGERTMSIRSGDPTVLEENMTLHFMPAIWAEEWGLETTEAIRIREGGPAECLSNVSRELFVKS